LSAIRVLTQTVGSSWLKCLFFSNLKFWVMKSGPRWTWYLGQVDDYHGLGQ